MAKYVTDHERIRGFDAQMTKQVSYRRRSARKIDVVVNGMVVEQVEFYATDEGFFIAGRGANPFIQKLA